MSYIYIYISTTPPGAIPKQLLADASSERRVGRADSSNAAASPGGAASVATKASTEVAARDRTDGSSGSSSSQQRVPSGIRQCALTALALK